MKPPVNQITPYPWKALRACEDFNGPYFPLDHEELAGLRAQSFISIGNARGDVVAAAHDCFEFHKADASLIERAPNMFRALKTLVETADLAHPMGPCEAECIARNWHVLGPLVRESLRGIGHLSIARLPENP